MAAESDLVQGTPADRLPKVDEGPPFAWRCAACGRTSFPPRGRCPSCWSEEGDATELPAEGEVHSFTTVHVARPGMEAPYTVGYVDAGPVRLFARLRGEPHVGARGRIRVETGSGGDGPRAAEFVLDLADGAATDG
jgi:uncharacterized protein